MKFWRKIGIGALLLGILTGLWGCDVAKIKDLSVTSVGVKYLVPTSSRSMDAISFTVQDVSGVVKHYDREIARFTAGELPVQARSVQVYELPCTAVLAEKVSLLDLLAIAARRSMEGMTADVKLRVSLKGGKGTVLTFNGIDLSQFSD